MVCGTQLLVEHPQRVWVRALFDRRQWQPAMLCPKCGARSGGGRSIRLMASHPSSNPVIRFLSQLKHRRQNSRLADMLRVYDRFRDGDQRLVLARLVAAVPFPVYGLKDRPMGLRLRSPGSGSRGLEGIIDRISLGYVAGHPSPLDKAVQIDQCSTGQYPQGLISSDPGAAHMDLSLIQSLIANYVPREFRKSDPFSESFYRDWNIDRIENTPRQQATIRVNGVDIEARFISWDTPHRVVLAYLTMGTNSVNVSALNVGWDDLRETLSSLVVLQENPDVLAAHQQEFDEASRLLKEYLLSRYHT